MKFQEYLDRIYIKTNLELQEMSLRGEFDLKKQALTRVIPNLMNGQRNYFKFIGACQLLYGFLKAYITGVYPDKPLIAPPPTKPTLVKTDVTKAEGNDVPVTPSA